MTAGDIEQIAGCKLISDAGSGREITGGYTSDLLSDVMANAPDASVLITIQGHKNTIAVAGLAGIPAIILCGGRKAPEDMLQAAGKEKISIYSTDDNQFTASVKLARLLGLLP